MRTDLKLNYNHLELTSQRIRDYYNALDDIEDALKDLKKFLENQESESTDKLKEKLNHVTIDIGDKKNTSKQLERTLDSYIGEMKALVNAVSTGSLTRVDTWDISYNISQIEGAVTDLTFKISQQVQGGFHICLGDDEETQARKRKLERNYNRLENFRSGTMMNFTSGLRADLENIRDIYNKYLKPYEDRDDKFRSQLNDIYKQCTSSKDKWKNFWDGFNSITEAFLEKFTIAFALALALALAPGWLVIGAFVVVGVGCVLLIATPEEEVPSWLKGAKEAADGVKEKAVQVLKEGPMVLVEDIGQGLMDQIQTPEGIAAVAGETLGSIAGGYAGSKIKANMNASKSQVKDVDTGKGAGGTDKTLSNLEAEENAFNAIKGSDKADEVVLGKFDGGGPTSYSEVAKNMDAQYFELDNWDELASMYSDNEIWKINEKFLDIQTSSGRDIFLSHNPAEHINTNSFYAKELQYLVNNGYGFKQIEGGIWYAYR